MLEMNVRFLSASVNQVDLGKREKEKKSVKIAHSFGSSLIHYFDDTEEEEEKKERQSPIFA